MPEPIDHIAFHDFEHAGWQKASTFYADTFGTLTALTIDPLLDAPVRRRCAVDELRVDGNQQHVALPDQAAWA